MDSKLLPWCETLGNDWEILAAPALEARFATLVHVSRSIGAYRDPKALLDMLANELHGVVQFDYLAVSILDRDPGFWCDYVFDMKNRSALVLEADVAREERPAWWVYEHQQSLVTSTDEINLRNERLHAALEKYQIRSICILPLTTAHRKLGTISFGSKQLDAYSPDEVPFLSILAGQIALGFDNALNFRELQNKNERLGLLLELTNHVVSNLEFRDLLRSAATSTRRIMDCDGVGISLLDDDVTHLRVHALDLRFIHKSIQEESLLPIEEGFRRAVLRTGKPWCGSVQEARRLGMQDTVQAEVGMVCVLPIVSRRVLGLLGVVKYQDNAFAGDDIEFLTQIAKQIAIAVENAVVHGEIRHLKDQLSKEKLYLEDEIRAEMNFAQIIGSSTSLRRLLKGVETVAPTDSTVLIYGETGTGKELIARAIHDLSPRRSKPFVRLNCAAIPTGLLESELFGHEKGAFTGAIAQRIGRFEIADGGTIFLDEIGDIPLELQTKLLRVLQEREFERLGSSRTLRTDVRPIAATNRDLEAMVNEQRFRSDLFFRLNVFPVHVPPLRKREGDIPLLVRHFAQQFSKRMNKVFETIPSATMDALCQYHWPGNIRELQNVIERAVIISAGPVLAFDVADLKSSKHSHAQEGAIVSKVATKGALNDILKETQREQILKALEECNWIVSGPNGAAARLGMKRSTLHLRMQKLGISRRWG
ncbi:MAG TPA: sigma 54-interacting transcriptional regulator [Chthoniobacterales bacterium]